MEFDDQVLAFVRLAQKNHVRMIMVGGGAVNFHGYRRHSADVDFWIDHTTENLNNLKVCLNQLGFEFDDFPEEVIRGEQNVSIKISPVQEIELIMKFNPGKSFDATYESAEKTSFPNFPNTVYRVINFDDLITSKVKSGRPKDLLDIHELKRLKEQ